MGYALNLSYAVSNQLNLSETDLDGMSKNFCIQYIADKCDQWMETNLGLSNFDHIQAYNSQIPTGWYRAALRFGFVDSNNNGAFDIGEYRDFHWLYQTNEDNGVWADKQGKNISRKTNVSDGNNPNSVTWFLTTNDEHNHSYTIYYDSTIIYYMIKS